MEIASLYFGPVRNRSASYTRSISGAPGLKVY